METSGGLREQVLELNRTLDSVADANVHAAELLIELEAARAAAEESDRCKSVFLATMSHELRTPLNAIIGYSEIMREEAERLGQEGLADDATRICAAGNHLLELIRDILDYTSLEGGNVSVDLDDVPVAPMLDQVALDIAPYAARHRNRVEVRPLAAVARCDPERLRQCLMHLLCNAAKFTQDGVITVSGAVVGDTVEIRVADTGIGIAAVKMRELFQPFVQADDSPARTHGGTGLGLAISRRLCRLMGGELRVESTAGEGSVFTIELPAAR